MIATRRGLHAVAEHVIAGPQHRRDGTIRLRVVPGGFAGVSIGIGVEAADLVSSRGRRPLAGTCRELATAVRLDVGPPLALYEDHAVLGPDDVLAIDRDEAARLLGWFARGDEALRELAGAGTEPVLWPEHFDVAVTIDEVNYGVSAGDGYLEEPYAYVGPHRSRTGAFWNAPFGAAVPARALAGERLGRFFAEGRRLTAAAG